MIYIGSARSASLPDDGEVSEQPFYVHKLGWVVVRAKSKTKRHSLCMCMRNACANPLMRYSQNKREEVYKYGTNGDPGRPYFADCSSLVTQCIREAVTSKMLNSNSSTLAHNAVLTGCFEVFDYVDGKTELYNGDILVTKIKGHVVIVTRGAKKNTKTSK